MALQGFTVGNTQPAATASSPVVQPTSTTKALGGFNIGQTTPATSTKAIPQMILGSPTSSGPSVQSLVDGTKPTDTSSLFNSFQAANGLATPHTPVPKPAITATSTPEITSTIKPPKLSVPADFTKESSYLDTQAKSLTQSSKTLEVEHTHVESLKSQLESMDATIDKTNQKSIDAYNAKVKEYNSAASALQTKATDFNKSYGDYQARVDSYNASVKNTNVNAVYSGPSLTGSSISSDNGQSFGNDLKESLLSIGAPKWIANNPIVDTIGGAYNHLQDKIDTWAKSSKESTVKQVGKFLDVIPAVGNMLFSPVSAAFKLAEEIPVIKYPVQGIDWAFQKFGEAMTGGTQIIINNLPISQEAKDSLAQPIGDIVGLAAQIWVGGKIAETIGPIAKSKIADVKTIITQDMITQHIPGQSIYFDAVKVKDIWQTGKLLTDAEKSDILQTIGSDNVTIKDAFKNGISIGVDARTIVTLTDKPYWAKIKSFFGAESKSTIVSDTGSKPAVTVRGYLSDKNTVHPDLKAEVKTAIETYGPDVVEQALQDKLGLDKEAAAKVIADSSTAKTPAEIKAASSAALVKVAPESVMPAERAPSVLQITDHATGESTMQAIRAEDLEKFKELIDTGTTNKAAGLQDATGKSYHLSATKAERMIEAGVKPIKGYANHEKISKLTEEKVFTPPKENAYYIQTRGENGTEFKAVEGKKVDIGNGVDAFVHKEGKLWLISEARSGMSIGSGTTRIGAIREATQKIAEIKDKGTDIGKHIEAKIKEHGLSPRFKEIVKSKTQKQKVAEAVKEKPLSIKEIAKLTKILEPNVRRILGEGAKEGTFHRVSEGVYVLKTKNGNFAYVEMGDAKESLARMAEEGQKFDSVILDPAYFSRALIGGNRGIKQWNFIMPKEFAEVMDSVSKLVASDDSHVYLMLSGARTAQIDMNKYVVGAIDAGLKVVGEGKFTKLFNNGQPVTNVRGQQAASERMILLTKSGTARAGEIEKSLDFRFIRPAIAKSYQTEKPAELMKALIEQSTLKGETVLDPFGGSGVTGAEAIKSGRNAVIIEKQASTVENFTKPRIEETARKMLPFTQESINKAEQNITKYEEMLSKPDIDEMTKQFAEKGIQDEQNYIAKRQNAINMQAGFVKNPAAIVEDIVKGADAKIKNFIETTMEPITVSQNLSDDFAKLEGAAQADLEVVNKLVEKMEINKKDDEALYTHAENPNAPLTERQKKLEETIDQPLKKANEILYKRIKDLTGINLPESDTYISRFPKEKPSVMQRIFNPAEGRTSSAGQGGVLSKSAPSLKKRTMKALIDEEGNRTVASIKDKEVTAFKDKNPESLGTLNIKPKSELLETEIKPLQKQVATIQSTINDLQKLNKAQEVVSPERLKTLGNEIDSMIKFVDSHVGVFSNAELMPTIKQIQNKSIEFNTLATVKETTDNNAITRGERLGDLQTQLIDLVNKMGEIENKYNPDELNQKVFKANNGKTYTIGEATTAEIEQHTNLEYHHSAIASRLMQYVKLRQIDRANQFLESWKSSSDFEKVAVKNDQIPPQGWRLTTQQNFRNYYFEPRTAEILDDMQKKMGTGMYNDAFQGINRVLANAIFFNGLAHPINVLVTWAYNRGASSLVLPSAYKSGLKSFSRAVKAMHDKNADYAELLKNGAHLMSSDVTTKKLAENLIKKLGDEMDAKPDLHDRIIKALGYAGRQLNFKNNVVYKLSHDMAWLSNDLFTIQSIFEAMDRYKMTMPEAIKEVSRFIPDYRQQARLLDRPLSLALGNKMGGATARNLAKNVIYNRNLSMFGSYHVGLMQALTNALKDTVNAGEGFTSKESYHARGRALDKLAMLALIGLVIYPAIDKLVKKLTGNSNTYITRSGVMKYPYLAYKYFTGNADLPQVLSGLVTPAVGTQTAVELFFNRDLFTGNNVYGIGGEGLSQYLMRKVAPAAELTKVASGDMTPGNFALTFLGIHTPKNDHIALDLNEMIYTEKPNILRKMKALIAGGDTVGAQKMGHEFNTHLVDIIKQADIEAGNSGSDARVQFFLNQYGIKMPGPVAMANYSAKEGQNIVDKTLPNGKPIIVKDTPVSSQSVIGTIVTYARAIGTDPVTAFKDIFSGQHIKDVRNGTIIVQRMSLAESQTAREKDAKNQGLPSPKGMNLDHIVSLEFGGDNSEDNLQLIPEAQWKANTPVENFLAKELNAGRMNKDEARELSIRFKAGLGEILSPSLMEEYKNKYKSQPLTAEEVKDYKNTLDK